MTKQSWSRGMSAKVFALTGVLAGVFALAPVAAIAGECPAGKSAQNSLATRATTPSGVTDNVIASIDLAQEQPRLRDHKFRLRRLVIQPGGVVPFHSHADRPAIIYIVSGTINEYSSECAVPIVHRAGEVARETHVTSHWWKNTSRKPAVLLSADILHDKADPKTM